MGDLLVDQPMPGEQLKEDGSGELLGRAEEADAIGMHEIQQGTHQGGVQVFPVYTVRYMTTPTVIRITSTTA